MNNFIQPLIEKAKKNPKSIVFPESSNEKVLLAARKVCDLGIAYPILLGEEATISELAKSINVSMDGITCVDINQPEFIEELVQVFLHESDMFSEKALNRKFKSALNVGAAMVRVGKGDCLAAGIDHTTGEVILASQMFIGLSEGIKTVSSIGIVEAPGFDGPQGNLLAIADCAVCQNPDASELSDIACASADTMKDLLGWESRVAMISFSTDGSGQHVIVDKVVESVQLSHERRPELLIDGEFQLDAAINPAVAAKKVKRDSLVAGKANILVFPDLNAGNIGVKLIQTFGKALAHGPLLQGFAKPVTDFSRSAPVDEIVGNLTMLVVRAGQ